MFKRFKIYVIGTLMLMTLFVPSCDLEEEIQDKITSEIVASDPNLLTNIVAAPIAQLRGFWYRERIWGLMEATSDELYFPTRGSDWFDGGVWQADYLHNWLPTHRDVVNTWNSLSTAVSRCNITLYNLGIPSVGDDEYLEIYRAQVTFLRSFFEYYMYDFWRINSSRDPYNQDFLTPADIYRGDAGFYRLVGNVKRLLPLMKDRNYVSTPNVDEYKEAVYGEPDVNAGYMLLAKLYLNKEVYTGVAGYDSCLIYLNRLIDESGLALANDYYDIFSTDNDTRFKTADDEAILVAVLDDQMDLGIDNQTIWIQPTFHYNQTFGGRFTANWNGNCAPETYLQETWIAGTDTATDVRWKDDRFFSIFGVNLGFNYGQQYSAAGDTLFDRNGNPLNYTFESHLLDAAEYEGVRPLKYPPTTVITNAARITNDFIIWRFADAYLMKAECLARAEGDVTGAMAIVNEIRTKRNAPEATASDVSVALEKIYTERGLELYWEGHRRQDMIRFGTFLGTRSSKPEVSPATAILFPIPQSAIDGSEGTITQNDGY
jgi:hypothetical protein